MAVENTTARWSVNNDQELRFTISGVDTSAKFFKFSLSLMDDEGVWDPATIALQLDTTNQPAQFARESEGPTESIIVLTVLAADTASLLPSGVLEANYHMEFETFNAGDANPLITTKGTATLLANNAES